MAQAWSPRRLGDGGSRDRLDGEALEDVTLHDIGGVGQADAALEAGLDLANIVLEPAQRVDPVGRDHLPAAPDAHAPAADDPALGHVRTRDHAAPDLDDLANLGAALD